MAIMRAEHLLQWPSSLCAMVARTCAVCSSASSTSVSAWQQDYGFQSIVNECRVRTPALQA